MSAPPSSRPGLPYSPKVLAVHLDLLQYPVLGRLVRRRMRDELFAKRIITPERFGQETHDKAVQSQKRELVEPAHEESIEDWKQRLDRVEEILTEFYYATNFSYPDFLTILEGALAERGPRRRSVLPGFNPEIAPFSMLFERATLYEQMPPEEHRHVAHHAREILVVLTKGMLSDQLSFVSIAKEVLDIDDLRWIHERRIGRGKIGGKAGGLMLARKILSQVDDDDPPGLAERIEVPEPCFLGSDVFSEFLSENGLAELNSNKYRDFEENLRDYPTVQERFQRARLPTLHRESLRQLLEQTRSTPLIVRSSSLLEDNFGIAFAGKYDSFFCPNQRSLEENLEALSAALKQVYASALSPHALVYRQQRGLIDYDERMGVLIQKVQGARHGRYFFPQVSGVGFSTNPIVWNPRIERDAGFLRIVAGLGTRAVDRLDNDYARMVALSHPTLQPARTSREVLQYSQKWLDVLDLESNCAVSIPTQSLQDLAVPQFKLLASTWRDGELQPLLFGGLGAASQEPVLTFDGLLRDRTFVDSLRAILRKLERSYRCPVDIEFTVELLPGSPLDFRIHLLQCRQQSRPSHTDDDLTLPDTIADEDRVFSTRRMVSTGAVRGVRYAVYVDPERYRQVPSNDARVEIARAIGQLNQRLTDEPFLLIGPGRWGSSNKGLGVPVSYGDIFNARVLVELALPVGDHPPEASYGTHFFQDLIEGNIYPLPIYPAEEDAHFDFDLFRTTPSVLDELLPDRAALAPYLRVVDFERLAPGCRLDVVMNADEGLAVGHLTKSRGPA